MQGVILGYYYIDNKWLPLANPSDFTSLIRTKEQSNAILKIKMFC